MSTNRKYVLLYLATFSLLISTITCQYTYDDKVDRNHLDSAGVVGIIFASLAFVVGLALFLYCCCLPKPQIVPPVVPDPFVAAMPVVAPVVTQPEPIVIDDAHPVVPCPMIEPIPQPILPPPRPVVPAMMPQPMPVMAMPQPIVTELPVIPVGGMGGVPDFAQPIFTAAYQ